ncbi:MAG: c-type cytochrome [Bacteroidales bacterium]
MVLMGSGWFFSCNSRQEKARSELLRTGDRLFHQNACITCHSLKGKEVYGPPLNGLYMKEVEVVRQGQTIKLTADRSYLKRAIADPRFEEVKGYESKDMPEVHISEEEIDLLVEYLIAINDSSDTRLPLP